MTEELRSRGATRRLDEFTRRIRTAAVATGHRDADGVAQSAVHLASHMALAVAVDVHLVHLLRINFFVDREP
jgi:hypothetical protein